jgi:hypothetical protein
VTAPSRTAQYSKNSAAKFLISGKGGERTVAASAGLIDPAVQPIGGLLRGLRRKRTDPFATSACGAESLRPGDRTRESRKRDPMCSAVSIKSFCARAVR